MSLVLAALALAGVVTATDAASDAVRVRARPEIPWVVAVVPVGTGCGQVPADRPEVRALLDAGGTFQAQPLVEAAGPPEAEALVVAAARACGRGPLFVEGRSARLDTGALPRPPRPSKATRAAATDGRHRLAPHPGLVDVEGAALEVFVAEVLAPLGAATARVVDDGAFALVVEAPGVPADQARALLEGAVAGPLPGARVEAIRAKARGRVAARRAAVGAWARDAARMWLLTGQIDVEDVDGPADLGTRLRARVFPALLFPTRSPTP